jgi:hypothetical protein
MDLATILAELKADRAAVEKAISDLEELSQGRKPNFHPGVQKPPGGGAPPATGGAAQVGRTKHPRGPTKERRMPIDPLAGYSTSTKHIE